MPFTVLGRGRYQYGGVTYHAVECGGGGNCLFLSLATGFRHHHVDDHATSAALRASAADTLFRWALWDPPAHIPTAHVALSDMEEAVALEDDGEYAGNDAIVAIVEEALLAGSDVEVHVLGPTLNDVLVYRSANAIAPLPAFTLHLLYIGFSHYRLLVPDGQQNTFDPRMVISNMPTAARKETEKQKGKKKSTAAVSLRRTSDSTSSNSTVRAGASTQLEIRHLDVGQGESTLIYIRDVATNAILRSILIDAGRTFAVLQKHLDALQAVGDFKPIDTFFASHYDNDHIGAAATLLDSGYVDPDIAIYDGGDPPRAESDFTNYSRARRAANRRMPPLGTPILDDFHGVTLRCVYMNGVLWKNGVYFSVQADDALSDGEYEVTGQMMAVSNYPKNTNDWSLALVLEMGNFVYFTAGDLSGNYEYNVAEQVNALWGFVSAMKAGHHGAGEATTGGTLSLLKPHVVVISCGWDNDFGHPAQSCIDRLEALSTSTIDEQPTTATYFITGDVPTEDELSDGKFPPGTVGGNGNKAQGTIAIVTDDLLAQQIDHTFYVFTDAAPAGARFDCDDRTAPLDENVTEYTDKKRRRKGVTDDDVQQRSADRAKRRRDKAETAKLWLLDRLEQTIGKGRLATAQGDPRFAKDLQQTAANLARGFEQERWASAGAVQLFIERWSNATL